MNASLSPKFRFGAESKAVDVSFSSPQNPVGKRQAALTNAEYLRQSCSQMQIPVGPREHTECPHRVTFDRFAPSDSEALRECINAAYRQVLGNAHVMDHERLDSLEAELTDGRLCTREFIRGLAKSELYKARYFFKVSAYRGIELNFKHLLGRPPLDQQEIASAASIQSSKGFDALIDSIIDSAEYAEVFGDHGVPYVRSFTSASGMSMLNFVRIAALEQNFASSDRSKGNDSCSVRTSPPAHPWQLMCQRHTTMPKCLWHGQEASHPQITRSYGVVLPSWVALTSLECWSM